MANSRTGLVIKPVTQIVAGLSSLYRRPPDTIRGIDLDGWMSPGQPVQPFGPPGTQARAFQTWSGQNQNFTPRPDADFTAADLKALATYPLARICIENVKDTVTRAPWEIQARAKFGESRKEVSARTKGDDTLRKLNDFFQYPDREHNWQEWLRPLLDDLLVIDAASILMQKTFKGEVVEIPVMRGEMFTRLIDNNGFTPLPPNPAYQQNWWGLPLLNLTTDQLVYKPRSIVPRNTLSSQLYGMSPTEQLAGELQVGIKRLQFVLAYYTEGSIPGVVQVVPRGTSPDRLEEAMDWQNSQMAGNLAKRNQWRLIQGFNDPGKPDQILFPKEPLLADLYDEKHIREVAFGYGTSPQRLMKMIRTEGSASSDAAEVEGTLPWVLWIKGVVDYIIQRKMGFVDYEIALDPYAEPDPLKNAAALTMLVGKAILTPNEARKRVGEELHPEPEADQLGVISGTGFLPIGVPAVTAGVMVDEQGNVKPHPVKPTPPPTPPMKPNGAGHNASRGGTPASQEAGSGRSKGKNTGTPNGRESLDGKKKITKRIEPRIEPHVLTPESQQSVHVIQSAVHKVFQSQHVRAQMAASKFNKIFGNVLSKREFGNVQFNLSPDDAARVAEITVDSADLAEKGRDLAPHVTVLWGFHASVTTDQLDLITRGTGDVPVTLEHIEAFPEGPEGVPLVIRVESEKLRKLRDDLKILPHTLSWPDYKPHICIAYLKPGHEEHYLDVGLGDLEGETFTLSQLVYSGIDYTVTDLAKLMLPSERIRRLEKAN